MKKRIAILLAALLAVGSLTACGGKAGNSGDSVNVGLGLYTQMSSSKGASAEEEGLAQADLTVAAVTLNSDGTIAAVKVDTVEVKTTFDTTGTITSDTAAEILSKRERGDNYGMTAMSKVGEWYEQADVFEAFCVGKTIDEVKAAMGTDFKPSNEELLAGCTMKIDGFVVALEKACAEAATGTYTASASDKLSVAITAEVSDPVNASAEGNGSTTAYANFVAVTAADGAITACVLDAVQATVSWDATGAITSDLTVDTTTKHDLKEKYGMTAASQVGEWYQQADAFMSYVKGMTADQVAAIPMDDKTAPTDENLTAGCTIKIGPYVKVVGKALAK